MSTSLNDGEYEREISTKPPPKRWTPGPWWCDTNKYGDPLVREAAHGLLIADVIAVDSSDEHLRNQALIAAAPDLYDALATLILNIEKVDYHHDSLFAAFVDQARTALAKVTPEDSGTDSAHRSDPNVLSRAMGTEE